MTNDERNPKPECPIALSCAVAGFVIPIFEEATRVLFAKKKDRFKAFEKRVHVWPRDIRRHVIRLMKETIRSEEMPCE